MARLGSLSEVHLEELVLRDDLLVATHLLAVEPAPLLSAPATTSFSGEESRAFRLHGALLVARDTVKLTDSRLGASSPSEALIACLVPTVVDPGADHGPDGGDAEEEADEHVTHRHNVVHCQIVAADAEGLVVARCVIVDVFVIAVGHTDRRHRDPAKQERVEPDIEDKHHVIVRVAPPHTIVHPDAVRLIPVCALVARLAVHRTRWFDHLALGAQLVTRKLFD